MTDRVPHSTDENLLTLPETWRRALHPRRGGVPVPMAKPARTAPGRARALLDERAAAIASPAAGGYGDRALADAARRHLDGAPDPAGAAAVAAVVADRGGRAGTDRAHKAFFDAWVVEHGLAFAACALVELGRTGSDRETPGDRVGAVHLPGGARPRLDGALERRARGLLAAAGDGEYAEAVRRLEGHRPTLATRALVAYLVPTRRDWVDESFAEIATAAEAYNLRWLTMYSLSGPEHLANRLLRLRYGDAHAGLLATMLDGVGADVLPFLAAHAGDPGLSGEDHRNLCAAAALLPTDEAFASLLDRRDDEHARPALRAAMRRFPVRALRLLAAAGVGDLLDDHVRAHRETVGAALPGLPEGVRAVVEPVAAAHVRVPEAPPESVPGVLADPVWRHPVRPVMAGLEPPATHETVWRDGERAEWLATATPWIPVPRDPHWTRLAESCRRGHHSLEEAQLLLHGPEDLARSFLPDWTGYFGDDAREHMRVLVARHGRAVFDAATSLADHEPGRNGDVLLPFLDAGTAMRACGWAVRRGPVDAAGLAWLDRHGPAAAPFLVPAALGGKVRPRRAAEAGLRRIAARHGAGAVVDAAPPEARDALRTLLAAHPAQTGLAAVTEPGDWADPAFLPQVLMRDRDRALPATATRTLLELLTLPASGTVDAVRAVRDACAPESVAAFGRAIFERWLEAGAPAREIWALAQLAATGGDAAVRLLTPLVRAWGDGGGAARAAHGLDVFVALGSDPALAAIHDIALRTKSPALWKEARQRFDRAAAERGLSPERLADRLVPDFGLAADGTMTLDYGPRRFTVGFDEQLKPTVVDGSGTLRKSLPKPGAKDDPVLAPAAHDAFTTLKRDVRAVASDQRRRLQRAMVAGRRWELAEFRDFVAGHPLVRHLARRLVWTAHHPARHGEAAVAFRVAEDGTFADVHDDAFTVPGPATIGLPHPLHLGGAVDAWSELFADYEILQPFPQLGRPVIALTEGERRSVRLERFAGVRLSDADLAGLRRRGWYTDRFQAIERTLASGHRIEAETDSRGAEHVVRAVRLAAGAGTFGDLDPVALSETLTALAGPAA
ncbi:DUF4132 domain-containing protein [Actinomadura sp. WMMB 499]|uniref:DUF4132 domain-containing protein n=1 Tax=Actinomadura sp. WMMB 499 TaxID=1219491 RepID=UPI0012487E4F|nr:DUF4132 domain-containing protein [Actinomadura sp. WMMB 499]QFG20416.1 DUF4132 domain-containing protein [Actinomadura sp. WMMB 499]